MNVSMQTIPAFAFERAALLETAARLGPAYRVAAPFPHTAIDDFLPAPVAEGILAEFPAVGDIEWRTHDNPRERKLGASHERPESEILADDHSTLFRDIPGEHVATDPPPAAPSRTRARWWQRR